MTHKLFFVLLFLVTLKSHQAYGIRCADTFSSSNISIKNIPFEKFLISAEELNIIRNDPEAYFKEKKVEDFVSMLSKKSSFLQGVAPQSLFRGMGLSIKELYSVMEKGLKLNKTLYGMIWVSTQPKTAIAYSLLFQENILKAPAKIRVVFELNLTQIHRRGQLTGEGGGDFHTSVNIPPSAIKAIWVFDKNNSKQPFLKIPIDN